jgi:hypothetical protein
MTRILVALALLLAVLFAIPAFACETPPADEPVMFPDHPLPPPRPEGL